MSAERPKPSAAALARWSEHGPLAAVGAALAYAIVVYVAALAALRLSFSSFLEVDEAEFVGRVDLRLVYDNSHPPLFNWLTRLALEIGDWNWPVAVAAVKYGALAVFHLAVWDLARRLGGPRAAALAVAASAFLPQVVWMSAVTLAHSTLTMAAAALTLWAAWRALEAREARSAWIWFTAFGAAAAAGALSKFNFGLFLAPFVAAVLVDPLLRARAFRAPALAALAAFAAAAGPSLVAAVADLETSASRIDKLYRGEGPFAAVDVPGVGVDGVLSLGVALLAWAAAAGVVWTAARAWDRRRAAVGRAADGDPLVAAVVRALGRTMVGGLALFALIVAAADMHSVHERYLTPILSAAPVWLAVARPLRRSAGPTCALAAMLYLAALAGFWGMVQFSPHRFMVPYEQMAGLIRREATRPMPIYAEKHDDAANALLALGWPGAVTPERPKLADDALLLWRGRGVAPLHLAPPGFGPAAGVATVALLYRNGHPKELVYSFQRFERLDR